MRETVKVVKGYEITRMKGCLGHYQVTLETTERGMRKYMTFRTIKAAAEYINKYL